MGQWDGDIGGGGDLGNGTAGVAGVISATNSLVGTSANDKVGFNVNALANGNYVVRSAAWNDGATTLAGAATWGNGTVGVIGAVSAANSLVGTSANDQIGTNLTTLTNGNYVLSAPTWTNGAAASAGAATWVNGTTGLVGAVSASNSLVGTSANDKVGSTLGSLTNGDYVVISTGWANGTVLGAGLVAWGSGTAGLTGVASAANSIVGSSSNGKVGNITPILATTGPMAGALIVPASLDGVGGRVYVALPLSLLTYAMTPNQTMTIRPSAITDVLNTGTALTLQANNDITVNSAVTVNNPSGNGGALTLQAGRSILINANITTDNGNLTLIGNDLLANGVINAQRDTGAAVITMVGGTTIDAGTGAVVMELRTGADKTNSDTGAVTLDAVTAGTLSVHNLGLTAGSDIALNGGTLTVSGTGEALVLATDVGNFNNAGSATLSTANGRWLIYSKQASLNANGGLTGTDQGNTTYAGSPPGPTVGSGNMFLYSAAVGNALTFSPQAYTITYGDALPTYSYTYSGLQGADTLTAVVSGTPSLSSTATAGSGVGAYTITVDLSGLSLNNGYTYTLGSTTATLTIIAKTLTVGGSKVYDGTTTAPGMSLSGLVGSDSVTGTGTLNDKNVGTKTVSGLSLSGTDAGNYTLASASYDVTAKALTGSGSRAYDGTTAASGMTLSGLVGSDSVTGDGTLNDKNVGTKTVSGLSLSGTDAGNYTLGSATYAITAKALSGTGSRVYDGTTSIAGFGLSGVVGSEDVSLSGAAALSDKNVGTKTLSGLSLSGADAGNYTLGSSSYTITAKTLTSSGSRVYDGTTTASGMTLSGVVGSESVSLSGAGTLNDKNAGTKTVSGLSLSGTDAGNYTLGSSTYTITAKALTGSGSKVYDGTTTASGMTLSGLVGSDSVTGDGTLNDKNVGSKTVSGLSLSGTDAGNYTLASATYTVTAKALTGSGSRAYDGTTAASGMTLSGLVGSDSVTGDGTLNDKNVGTKTVGGLSLSGTDAGNYTLGSAAYTVTAKSLSGTGSRAYDGTTSIAGFGLSGVVGSEDVSLSGAAALSDKNVGTKTFSGLSLSGTDAGNYTLGSSTYTITAKALTGSGSRVYDGTTSASGMTLSGVVGSESVSLSGAGTLSDKNVGSKTVSGLSLSGTDAGNYTLASAAYTVTAKTLTGSGSRVYDGTTAVSGMTLLGLVGSDSVTGDGTLNDKTVGSKTVSGLSLSGTDAGNYTLGSAAYTVTAKTLTGSGSRVYDGTTATSGMTLSGLVGADVVTGAGTLNDKNVGTKTVSGLSLSGTDAGNYTLASAAYAVTAKALTASGSKIYDGTTAASGMTLSGLVGSDSVSGDGTLNDKTVGSKTVNGLSLSGTDAGNYTLGSSTYTVTAKTLTASGSKVYDGTTAASGMTLSGLVGSDSVTGGGTLNDKTVGTKTVGSLSLSGTDAGNYTLGSAAYTVTAKTLTASGSKVYDGTTTASGMTLSGLVGSDSVTGDGTLNDKTVGSKTVSGLSLSGTDAGNYTLGSAAYTVTAKTLTASGSKVYDGTTTASGMALSGLVGSDSVTGGGTLNDKNVGSKTVSGLSLSGTDAGNYILGSAAYSVTAKSLTWSVAGASATYGDLPTLGTATLNGLIGGDSVTATIAAFADGVSFIPTVGTGAGSYSQQVVGLSGTDAGNYTMTGSGNTAGRLVISPTSLVVAADSASKTVGAVDPALSYRVSGLKGSDTSDVLSGSLSRAFGDTVGTYLIGQGTLAANSNYVITFNGATFTVLSAAGTGTTTVTGTGTGTGTGTVTGTTSPTVIAAVNSLPVVVTPLSSNTGNVLAPAARRVPRALRTSPTRRRARRRRSARRRSTPRPPPSAAARAAIRRWWWMPVSVPETSGGQTRGAAGRTVENSLSIGGVTVAFRQPSGFTGAGVGNTGGSATAEGGNNGGTLAFASSFTTFRADDSVNSAVDGGTAADRRRVGQ